MNFYFEAAKILDRLDTKQGSIKGVLSTVPEKDRKRTAALVIETLKYKSILTDVIAQSKLISEERRKITSMNLALVLVHDVLLSNGIQAGDGPVKQAILRHKTRLHGEFQKIKIKRGVKSNVELAQSGDATAARIPRYVRVNTAVWTTEEAIELFMTLGYSLSDPFSSSKGFGKDIHVPDLLLFPSTLQFHEDPLYKSGKIILQDKASCFPAVILAPPARDGAVIIDATAAPGNKTSHLSALMQNRGKIFAFERDKRRFSTLKMMLAKAHCRNVEPVNGDFLTVEPSDPRYVNVTHILLDPSCSGSGIVNRLDYLLETEEESAGQEERLSKLAAFQLIMVKHAMKFPSVAKIVYSTCSVHAAENEHVVQQALDSEEAQSGGFILAPRAEVLPTWAVVASWGNERPSALSLVRCIPGEDATNGFFVSCFVRRYPPPSKPLAADRGQQKRKKEEADGEPIVDAEGPRTKRKKRRRANKGG